MAKKCEKCGRTMTKIYRHHHRESKKWISKLVNEITDSKGDLEFVIKSGHWYYTIWYCSHCDTVSKPK